MPVARRSRTIEVAPEDLWRVVGDPSHLVRWWPRVERIEGVGRGAFTQVMKTKKGRNVRADFHVVEADRPRLHRWAQDVEGTPFERFLALNETTVELEPRDGATRVTLTARQKLRGLSRVGGGFMLKRATAKQLEEALEGLERIA
jgi:uncharacterized protein YndB with AHSA1/START domain